MHSRTPALARHKCVGAGLLLLCGQLANAGKLTHSHDFAKRTYRYGEKVPISCLNRTIDAGEHISDSSGNLQYIPFPICNETHDPLSFHYGVSETVTCTIDSLPDTLYHLFEYYVHSDAPLSCRMPTVPLLEPNKHDDPTSTGEGTHDSFMDGGAPAPFTPLTMALQGTLQKSHLHIWSDMNVLIHQSIERHDKKTAKGKRVPGQVVAGAAYSIPAMKTVAEEKKKKKKNVKKADAANMRVTWDPWKPGEGAKVLRGEPLTFKFRVSWTQESDLSALVAAQNRPMTSISVLYNCFLFAVAASIGGMIVLCWEQYRRRKGRLWNGDGILGHSSSGQGGFFSRKGHGVSINLGSGSKPNGYGGYGFDGKNDVSSGGYGGYSSGKRD
ncbi:hypothetical protein LOZ55_002671 [Ophidiomyces ophidiicola]|nr:hypothetical protein LOZ55_002671 [Ophidiomyces ophidiicola]